MNLHVTKYLLTAIAFWATSQTVIAQDNSKLEFFEKKIRPIFVNHCIDCHGPDEASGKLRLDSRKGWLTGGERGPAIVPGDPSSSLLIRAVKHTDATFKMPPSDNSDPLSKPQIRDLEEWIRRGAVDPRDGTNVATTKITGEDHWAFQPIMTPEVPADGNPIDFLIDRILSKQGFRTTDKATERTLARRMAFDLHGLPPSSEMLNRLEDGKLTIAGYIHELLQSPRYGERWARHWLDVARYSDAKDGVLMYGDARIRPFAYTYRDYVIRSFNDDKPFIDFVREQIAADKLGLTADAPELAAMGLLTLGRMFDNNPHDVIDDQIDTVTRAFLGLTVSCARCHDHKFDPIPTADYYSLYGVFASSEKPIQQPRIAAIDTSGEAYETELKGHLESVFNTQSSHYQRTLDTARDRTARYLVQVATTKPDVSETAVFFLSLLPDQLRPPITYQWRRYVAQHDFADDPVFGAWHDMMQDNVLREDASKKRGIDQRIIDALVAAEPKTKADIAQVYGETIRGAWAKEKDTHSRIQQIDQTIAAIEKLSVDLAGIVGGGNGLTGGTKGHGIHPGTGAITEKGIGFIELTNQDTYLPVEANPFVDGVFVPKSLSNPIVTSTGIKASDLPSTTGTVWDYVRNAPSEGFTSNVIDGIDYSTEGNQILGLHANKGVTFDIKAIRSEHGFTGGNFKAALGNGGEKGQTQLDFHVLVDGKTVVQHLNIKGEEDYFHLDISIPEAARVLTLISTEGQQGLSHDQAILGNARIEYGKDSLTKTQLVKIEALKAERKQLEADLANLPSLDNDPLAQILLSTDGPVWFPKSKIYLFLSRQEKDAYRGMLNTIDSIAVKHAGAAARAMTMVDSEQPYAPVIFQRGDATMRGNPVPRQFLAIASPDGQRPFEDPSGRLGLANAISAENNPLTARVWVNRIWMHHFGSPLVENPSDFGLRTKQPIYHEVLDYLATQLIRHGWRTKPLHKLIMNSSVYQRASLIPETETFASQLERDPGNEYFWHANRRRLDLEQMRDTFLVVSGQLNTTMYGRPASITSTDNLRRTIYSFVERQNIPNVVQTFDFANADTSTARRVQTTVPQQALYALNSDFVGNAATALANQLGEGSDKEKIIELYRLVFSRPPNNEELALGAAFVEQMPWEQYTQVILMTNELMFID
ncbi:MAG: DUF1553 domain-containing protein [Pirellulales bacterium]|nr:DUF1553 domain-containing protein [Pirellulales bacterium]